MVNNIMALSINDAELSTHAHSSGKAAQNSEGGNGFLDAFNVLVKDEPASRPRTTVPEKKTVNQNAEEDEAAHAEVRADAPASTHAVTKLANKSGGVIARIGTDSQTRLDPNDVSAASAQKSDATKGPSGVSFNSAQAADGMPNNRNSQATTKQSVDSTDSLRDILMRSAPNGQQVSPEDRKKPMQQLINTLTRQQAGEVQNNANRPAGMLNAQNPAAATDSIQDILMRAAPNGRQASPEDRKQAIQQLINTLTRQQAGEVQNNRNQQAGILNAQSATDSANSIRDILMRATQNGRQVSPEDRKQAMQQLINTLIRQQAGDHKDGAVPDQSETAKSADRSSALSTPSNTRQNLPAGLQIRPPAMSAQAEISDVQTVAAKKSMAAIRTSGTPEADLNALNTKQTDSDGSSLRLVRTPGDNVLTPARENLAMNLQYPKNQSVEAGPKDAVAPEAPKTSPATPGNMAAFMAGTFQATQNSQAHLRQVDHRRHLKAEAEPAKHNRNVSETDNARQMLSRVRVSNPEFGGSKGFDTPSDNRGEQGRFAGNASGTQASNSSNSTTETPRTPDMSQPQRALQANVTQQVSQQALQAVRNGMSEVRIDLKPESLGKLRMHISTADGQVTLKIIAETPQAKALIESDLQQLRTELKNQGLEMDKCQVLTSREAEQHGNSRQQGNSRPAGARANASGGSEDGDDETLNAAAQATGIEDGRVSLFA